VVGFNIRIPATSAMICLFQIARLQNIVVRLADKNFTIIKRKKTVKKFSVMPCYDKNKKIFCINSFQIKKRFVLIPSKKEGSNSSH
jgi:bisphosphoglycerate-independent phosphoglycerate mutase (AlkP superfamily)